MRPSRRSALASSGQARTKRSRGQRAGGDAMSPEFDVVVIGAGFGGLGCALTLGELGARVCLCEMLKYPGGCASTFSKGGFRFDAGATLLSGLGEEQLFGRWLAK